MLGEIEAATKASEGPVLYTGTVVKTVSSEEDGLMVRIHGFKGQRGRDAWGPMPWQPRYDVGNDIVEIVFPQKGDLVFVMETDEGDAVAVLHWPF